MRLLRGFNVLAITVFALGCVALLAQKPTATARPSHPLVVHPENQGPVGCTGNCLWYSGDTDFSNENWDALFNGSNPNFDALSGQVWVPFSPSNTSNGWLNEVKITSITFNEVTSSATAPDVTAMSYAFKGYIYPGGSGADLDSGSCNYFQPVATGRAGRGFTEYAYTCILPNPVYLSLGYIYWVNVYPTISNDDTDLYLSNAIDSPELNHIGWGDTLNYSFFNGIDFDADYEPADDVSSDLFEFSVGITGTYVHVTPKPRI